MGGEEIKDLKKGEAEDAEVETRTHDSLETAGSPRVASRDKSAPGNSSAPDGDADISLRSGKADREYPGINEHPGYWGIFVRKGS